MADEQTIEVQPTATEWDSWSQEQRDTYTNEHPNTPVNFHPDSIPGAPAPGAPMGAIQPVEAVPAQAARYKGEPEAGMQRIAAAIRLLESHSAARAGGSIIAEALTLLEQGYSVLLDHHPLEKDNAEQA
jgi:hypothetical protein